MMIKLLLLFCLWQNIVFARAFDAPEAATTPTWWAWQPVSAHIPAWEPDTPPHPPQTSGQPGGLKLPVSGYVSLWSQDCSGGPCSIPLPLAKNKAISFELALPQAPGQAQPHAIKEIFLLPNSRELILTLNFYAVCPYAAAKSSDTCPTLYFQAQAELAGAADAFCAAALNQTDFTPFPVLLCGGAKTSGVRFGATLHRRKL